MSVYRLRRHLFCKEGQPRVIVARDRGQDVSKRKSMQRRAFFVNISIALQTVWLTACATGPLVTYADRARRRDQIDVDFYATLERIRATETAARRYIDKARGMLLFPTVLTGGLNNTDVYGEGVLKIGNTMLRYYSIQSSDGLPTGMRGKVFALLFLFMTQDALDKFLVYETWQIGTSPPVTVWSAALIDRGNDQLAASPIISVPLDSIGIIADLDPKGMMIAPLDL